jgi:hypothetical protein
VTEKQDPSPEQPALPAVRRLAHELRSAADFADWQANGCSFMTPRDQRCDELKLRAAKLLEAVALVEGVANELGGTTGD